MALFREGMDALHEETLQSSETNTSIQQTQSKLTFDVEKLTVDQQHTKEVIEEINQRVIDLEGEMELNGKKWDDEKLEKRKEVKGINSFDSINNNDESEEEGEGEVDGSESRRVGDGDLVVTESVRLIRDQIRNLESTVIKIDQRIDGLEDMKGGVYERVQSIENKVVEVEDRMKRVEGKKLDDIDKNIEGFKNRVVGLEVREQGMKDKLEVIDHKLHGVVENVEVIVQKGLIVEINMNTIDDRLKLVEAKVEAVEQKVQTVDEWRHQHGQRQENTQDGESVDDKIPAIESGLHTTTKRGKMFFLLEYFLLNYMMKYVIGNT